MKDKLKEKLIQSEKHIREGLENITNLLDYKADESGQNKNFPKAVITYVLVGEELSKMLNELQIEKDEYIKLESKVLKKNSLS